MLRGSRSLPSVVIAAHNEENVIGRCLDALFEDGSVNLDVTVVANGCSDETVQRAYRAGARVLELPQPGKARALNAGDAAAEGFPRLYLDADMALSGADVAKLAERLEGDPAILACAPRRVINLDGRPLAVRAYFKIQQELPVNRAGLFGRGAVMVSEAGRSKFGQFPDETADDLFLDALYAPHASVVIEDVTNVVEAPLTTKDLLRRLVRVRRGNRQLRRADLGSTTDGEPITVRASDRWSWLRDVVLVRPSLAPVGVVYATLTLLADWGARRRTKIAWGRDESTRGPVR
jgi:glycosyltransferase involved in cell wall biosynthesis